MTRQELQQALKTARVNGVQLSIKLNATTEALKVEYDRINSELQADFEDASEAQVEDLEPVALPDCEHSFEAEEALEPQYVRLTLGSGHTFFGLDVAVDPDWQQSIWQQLSSYNANLPALYDWCEAVGIPDYHTTRTIEHVQRALFEKLVLTELTRLNSQPAIDSPEETVTYYELGTKSAQEVVNDFQVAQYDQVTPETDHGRPMIMMLTALMVFISNILNTLEVYVLPKLGFSKLENTKKLGRYVQAKYSKVIPEWVCVNLHALGF